MGLFSDLFARLKGKSATSVNEQSQSIDPTRISRMLNNTTGNPKPRDKLLEKLLDANTAAFPIGSYVKPSIKDPNGPLALHLTPVERMKIWLSNQKPEVVDVVAQELNWDQAEEVILWILGNKKTDVATAVKLFMKSEPAYYAMKGVELRDFAKDVIETFSANWDAGNYVRGTVGYDPRKPSPGSIEIKDKNGNIIDTSDFFFIDEFNRAQLDQRSSGALPWPFLQGLEGPFVGPEPKGDVSEYFKNDREGYFTLRFLLGGLGTWIMDDEIDDEDYKKWLFVNGFIDEAENI